MRKILVLTVAAMFLALGTSAKMKQNEKFKYGVKVGANLADMTTESIVLDEINPCLGYQFGAFVKYDFWLFSVQPELIFSTKGGNMKDATNSNVISSLNGNKSNLDYRSNYIEMPVNLQFGYKFGKVKYMVLGGPYVSFLTGGSFNGESDLYKSINEDFRFRKIDFGLGAGAGAEYKKFQLSMKYDWGMVKAGQKTPEIHTDLVNPFSKMKNRNISVSLGYIF